MDDFRSNNANNLIKKKKSSLEKWYIWEFRKEILSINNISQNIKISILYLLWKNIYWIYAELFEIDYKIIYKFQEF